MKHIISRGNKYVIVCPECECKFSFEREDIINASQFDSGDVVCPQCDTIIILKYEDGRYVHYKKEHKNENNKYR